MLMEYEPGLGSIRLLFEMNWQLKSLPPVSLVRPILAPGSPTSVG